MSYSYNHRKKTIKAHKSNPQATIKLFGCTWRYQFDGHKWKLEKVKRKRKAEIA